MMSTAEKCKELSQKKVKDDVTSRERRSNSFTRKSNNVNSVQSKPPKSQRTAGKAVKEPKNLKVGKNKFFTCSITDVWWHINQVI